MTKPKIGITTSYKDGVQSLSHHYIEAIETAGGLPMIVPMYQDAENMRAFVGLLDGLVITGGPGITRGLIGTLPEELPPVDPIRDTTDTLVYEAMADKPILGICYGMQFINAMAGGSIYADVQSQVKETFAHSSQRDAKDHEVKFNADSRIRRIVGHERMLVNTYHLQAIAEVGAGLRAVAHSPDGVIEAVESPDGRLLGVQFHPERMLPQTKPLFEDFVERCRP